MTTPECETLQQVWYARIQVASVGPNGVSRAGSR